jgi:phosphatidylinositol alpha-1,6-mannosyltransferase
LKFSNPLKFLFTVARILKHSRDIYLVHAWMDFPYSFLAMIIATLLHRPYFVTAVGTYSIKPFNRVPDRWFLKATFGRARKVFCISRFTELEIKRRIVLTNTKIINLGIDYDKFNQVNNLNRGDGGIRLLGVGALKHRKGFHISISALVAVKEKYPDVVYTIIGDQSDNNYFLQLKSLVREKDLEDNVVFLHNISDERLVDCYRSCDLFILTPVNINDNFEGFGLVYLEAGACGKPVIGTSGCGAEDAVIDGVTGLLVPQEDIQATGAAILKILSDNDLAAAMGARGNKFAKSMDWSRVADNYKECYELFLDTKNEAVKNQY